MELLIVGNWKSNKNKEETKDWLNQFKNLLEQEQLQLESKKIILCPSYTDLAYCSLFCAENNLPIIIGAQDTSSFIKGAHTGEVNATQLKEIARFVIVGHSERRKNGDTEEILREKVKRATEEGLEIIYCISDLNQQIPEDISIVAYEPIFAIGTSTPDTPENAQEVANKIKSDNVGIEKVLYGGSVTSENVESFTKMPDIDGVLVGGASLDPQEFLTIIKNV